MIIFSLLLFYRGLVSLMGTQNFWNLFLGVSGSLHNMTQFNQELKAGKEVTVPVLMKDSTTISDLKMFPLCMTITGY